MIGIVIATYERPDGKTISYLSKTLDSIDNQTFRDYTVYLVGDAYKNVEALKKEASKHKNIKCFILKQSPEQDRYKHGSMERWCAGGVSAVNVGISKALADGIKYICHQAHDDIWEPDHLEVINKVIKKYKPFFICTLSTYLNRILPGIVEDGKVLPFYPIDGGIVGAATCVKYSDTDIRPMDRLHVQGIMSPCDAYLWVQLRNEMKEKNRKGYLISKVTCHHDEEGYVYRNK